MPNQAAKPDFVAITASNSTIIRNTHERYPSYIYVGGAGDVAATTQNDVDVTFSSVAAGTLLPISPKKILSTGTTATGIVAIYG